jgi:hypothetical protein
VKSPTTGGIASFKPATHLNIWVCALTGGLLGYAQFPGGPQASDGVVINVQAFGTLGTAQAPFKKGRTATHEVGHYFNLRHIWADTPDCGGSDQVPDTPNCAGPNFGKPTWPVITCNNGPNGDMFMNYMDYVDDVAMFMFTTQQVLRIRATLDTARSGLKSASDGRSIEAKGGADASDSQEGAPQWLFRRRGARVRRGHCRGAGLSPRGGQHSVVAAAARAARLEGRRIGSGAPARSRRSSG